MYLLKANVPTSTATVLTDALRQLGVSRIRLVEVCGYTEGVVQERVHRGRRFAVSLTPEIELEALVPDEAIDEAVDAVMSTLRRLHHGDGYISVAPIEQCYRISTGIRQM
jgi:nitrogen regulatory protein P-II 1